MQQLVLWTWTPMPRGKQAVPGLDCRPRASVLWPTQWIRYKFGILSLATHPPACHLPLRSCECGLLHLEWHITRSVPQMHSRLVRLLLRFDEDSYSVRHSDMPYDTTNPGKRGKRLHFPLSFGLTLYIHILIGHLVPLSKQNLLNTSDIISCRGDKAIRNHLLQKGIHSSSRPSEDSSGIILLGLGI